jgi:uncharacterized protein (TIGR04562 family)
MGSAVEENTINEIMLNQNSLSLYENGDEDVNELIDKYSFDWELLEVIIGGKSSIDLTKIPIKTFEDADIFIKTYGYDLSKEHIRVEAKNIFDEAKSFIENMLIPEPDTKEINLFIPDAIKNEPDPRKLILIAGNPEDPNQAWACAMLRMMHTISHVNNDISLKFFPEIQRQILDKIWSSVYINSKGEKFFGDDDNSIKIYDVDIKAKKERNSMIVKLLHKVENVAADVFDQIGVRIITYDKVDALLAIRQLKKTGVLNFCNVKPSRSINRLIDTEIFSKLLDANLEKLKSGELTKEAFEDIIRSKAEKEASLTSAEMQLINPHTSREYKSIQFTARQMIRIRYPFNDENGELFSFFFPYELQIVDIETHLENRYGKGSYEKYKEKQLMTARKRVLGRIIKEQENSNN